MSDPIETDYLVVGAGAAGMAFTDALLTHSDATVTLVERRHAPGGHWLDAYPFVHLHQPSAFYGVDSVPLGDDALDQSGLNAGFYGLAGADELRAYYARVMQQHFLPSGRVRFFPGCDYRGGAAGRHTFTSRLTGATQEVRVRRKLVDTAYLEGRIPATSAPPFEVAEGVRCVPAGEVVHVTDHPGRYVVIGAGKTALDTLVWLLSHGVPAARIQWVKPREGWWLNRRYNQPHTFLPDLYAAAGLQLQVMAQASSVEEVFNRLESSGYMLRVDTTVTPTMIHGAIVSEEELKLLRQIQEVVRLGRVRRIEPGRLVLDEGTQATAPDALYVHCAASGLSAAPLRPIFEADRVTVQPIYWGFACFQFATLGVAEATLPSDEDKNRLCPPVPYWDTPADYLRTYLAALAHGRARAVYPVLNDWANASHLNPLRDIGLYRDHALVQETRGVIKQHGAAAVSNVMKLLARQGA